MGGRRRAGLSTADADKARRAARATTPSRASVCPRAAGRPPSRGRPTEPLQVAHGRLSTHRPRRNWTCRARALRCVRGRGPRRRPVAYAVSGGRKEEREERGRGGRAGTDRKDGSGPRHGLVVLRPRARASPGAPPAAEAGRLHAARTVGLRETERPPPAHESSTKPLFNALFQTLQYSVSRRRITSCRGAADFRVTHSCCSCGARAPPGPHHRLEGERVKSPQGRTVPHGFATRFADPIRRRCRPRAPPGGIPARSRGIPPREGQQSTGALVGGWVAVEAGRAGRGRPSPPPLWPQCVRTRSPAPNRGAAPRRPMVAPTGGSSGGREAVEAPAPLRA